MFKALKRLQLKRRGLSCGRTRRKQSENELFERLRESTVLRTLLLLAFMAGLGALVYYAPVDRGRFLSSPWNAVIVAGMIFGTAIVHLYVNHCDIFRRNSRVLLVFGAILLHLALIQIISRVTRANQFDTPEANFKFFLLPYALAPMLLCILIGRNIGIFATVYGSLFGTLLMNTSEAVLFNISSLIGGFVAVYVTGQVRRRSRFLRAGFYVGVTVLALGLVLGQLAPGILREVATVDWDMTGKQALTGLLTAIATAVAVGGLIPLLEPVFKITTDISWIELSDLNHPLLKRMTLEAPGTYHHSLVVANLAEAAAESIGANATMCRVASYFHDIGKLAKPGYFIENIAEGDNPHDDLTPTMSALVIIAHVKDGVDLALKNKLNTEIIDIIEQHHGNSLVYFFYRRALDQQEEMREQVEEGNANAEDIPSVGEKGFRYPGPKPQFKESGIISLADAVESASRTLQKPTPQKIEQTIDGIIGSRIKDGQLDECDLTLFELNVIKRSFLTTLRSMMHNRISYPKDDSSGEIKRPAKAKRVEKDTKRAGKKTGVLLP